MTWRVKREWEWWSSRIYYLIFAIFLQILDSITGTIIIIMTIWGTNTVPPTVYQISSIVQTQQRAIHSPFITLILYVRLAWVG
jgi:hypothetical protein